MLWHTPGFVTSSAPSSLGAQPGECPRLLRGSQHCFPPPSLSSACSQHGDPALLGGLGCSELPGGVCALRSCPSSAAVLVQITHMLWGNREVPSQGSVGWVCSLCLGLGDAPVVKTQKGSTELIYSTREFQGRIQLWIPLYPDLPLHFSTSLSDVLYLHSHHGSYGHRKCLMATNVEGRENLALLFHRGIVPDRSWAEEWGSSSGVCMKWKEYLWLTHV